MKRILLTEICLGLVSVWLISAALVDDIGSREEILNKSQSDLGYTNVPNWLKFPPPEHPDWEWDGIVAGVGVDSKDNVYVTHRGSKAPGLTVWKPDGTLLRVFPTPKLTRPHLVNIDKEHGDIVWLIDDGAHCIYKLDQRARACTSEFTDRGDGHQLPPSHSPGNCGPPLRLVSNGHSLRLGALIDSSPQRLPCLVFAGSNDDGIGTALPSVRLDLLKESGTLLRICDRLATGCGDHANVFKFSVFRFRGEYLDG